MLKNKALTKVSNMSAARERFLDMKIARVLRGLPKPNPRVKRRKSVHKTRAGCRYRLFLRVLSKQNKGVR